MLRTCVSTRVFLVITSALLSPSTVLIKASGGRQEGWMEQERGRKRYACMTAWFMRWRNGARERSGREVSTRCHFIISMSALIQLRMSFNCFRTRNMQTVTCVEPKNMCETGTHVQCAPRSNEIRPESSASSGLQPESAAGLKSKAEKLGKFGRFWVYVKWRTLLGSINAKQTNTREVFEIKVILFI